MKQAKILRIAGAAFLAGVIDALLFLSPLFWEWLQDRFSEHVQAVAARQPYAKWATLRDPEAGFEAVERRKSELPNNYVPAQQLKELKGRQLRKALAPGTIVSSDDLLPQRELTIDIGP